MPTFGGKREVDRTPRREPGTGPLAGPVAPVAGPNTGMTAAQAVTAPQPQPAPQAPQPQPQQGGPPEPASVPGTNPAEPSPRAPTTQAAPATPMFRPGEAGQRAQQVINRGVQFSAFDPRQRSRADVAEALQKLYGEGGAAPTTSLSVSPSSATAMGMAPGLPMRKQFEDQDRFLGILNTLR